MADGTGSWKSYMAYHDIKWIEEVENKLYVLASNNLYSYNKNDESITTYDKIHTLSDAEISFIGWNKTVKRLIIIYSNYNIDLLDKDDNVFNISDYQNKSMADDKTIYDVYMHDKYCYISTGFGIMQVNMADAVISNTYNLKFRVDHCYIDGDHIYAESSTKGQYKASLSSNLIDAGNWKWSADFTQKNRSIKPELLAITEKLNPGGPEYNHFGFMRYMNNRLYTCGGGWGMTDFFRPGTIQVLDNNNWQIYQDELASQTGYEYVDLMTLDIDPKNPEHLFAGGRTGVYEFNKGLFVKAYNIDNSNNLLHVASTVKDRTAKNYVIVPSMKFDASGNLFLFNSISPSTSLIEYTAGGEWINRHNELFKHDATRSLELVTSMMFGSDGRLWFVNNYFRTPSLYSYETDSKDINKYTTFTNEDGTKIYLNYVRCVTEDKEGNIWIGTDAGPLYLMAKDLAIPAANALFQQHKVPRNDGSNLADYLLSNVDITCIAVDGGNRKWFGTNNNGVYLISADNNKQIHHFLSSNSPLLSNNIESIAINSTTGEVYIGTNKGLCSYMSDSTEPEEKLDKDNIYAYPNPVTPDYTGLITVVGLTANADVKITTASGQIVAEGTSNGGTFTWDGNDLNGRKVASGVYMVLASTNNGNEGAVSKIAIIR